MFKIFSRKNQIIKPPVNKPNSSFGFFYALLIKAWRNREKAGGVFSKAKERPITKPLYKYWINKQLITLFIISLLSSCETCPAFAYTNDEAIKAIMGEASNQGKIGMLKIASAIRNRGTLKGVYGLKAKHIYKEPKWVWAMAREAWEASKNKDYANGADHWHNVKREGETYWTKRMIKVDEYKDHVFYRKENKNATN